MKKCKKITNYFSEFLKKEKENVSKTTLKCRIRHLDQFEEWLLSNGFKNITPNDFDEKILEQYKEFLSKKQGKRGKKVSETTQKDYLRTVRYFFSFLKGKSIDCIDPDKIRLEEKQESDIQTIVNYYFRTKGLSLEELKKNTKKKKIIYSRYTKPAKQLLELAGSVEKAKKAINKVAKWAKSRKLDYAIETVFKKWPELDQLKPKKKEKKPFYRGDRMVKSRGSWYVIDDQGEWLEFAGNEDDINWKEVD